MFKIACRLGSLHYKKAAIIREGEAKLSKLTLGFTRLKLNWGIDDVKVGNMRRFGRAGKICGSTQAPTAQGGET